MATPSHGYESARMATLESHTSTSITALSSITSTDPAAWTAITAVRGLQSTLENQFLPMVSMIRATDPLRAGGALGWGGDEGTWEYIFGTGTVHFVPFEGLDALFPGDDDVTAKEIVERMNEILERGPGEEQLTELAVLGDALDEIAQDEELSESVLLELRSDGVHGVYEQLFMLGLTYPMNETLGTTEYDPAQSIGFDLTDVIGDPFNQVVSAGAQRPAGEQIVIDAIDLAANASTAWGAAAFAGLARANKLPDDVAVHLLDTVQNVGYLGYANGIQDLDNSLYPDLEYDVDALELTAIGNNPILIEELIFGPDGFVPGGEELLADLLETNGYSDATDTDIGDSLGSIFEHIVASTPPDELVERDRDGTPSNTGVVFDLIDLVLDNDLKVPGLAIMEAIGPFLPEIMGSIPGTESKYTPTEVRSILKDLFEDLSPSQVEAALTIVVDTTLAKLPLTITSVDFNGGSPAGIAVGDMLDQLFGPVAGSLRDVVKDEEERAAFWRSAANDAFGLIPIPGNALAKLVIKKGVRSIIDGTGGSDGSTDAAVAAAQAALIANTVVILWADPDINAQVVQTALADWEDTKILLGGDPGERGGQELNDARIEEIHRALIEARDNGGHLNPDAFVDLPQIVDLIEEVSDETTLSPEREEGN